MCKGEDGFDGVVRELLVCGELRGEEFMIELYIELCQELALLGECDEKGVQLSWRVVGVRVDVQRGQTCGREA